MIGRGAALPRALRGTTALVLTLAALLACGGGPVPAPPPVATAPPPPATEADASADEALFPDAGPLVAASQVPPRTPELRIRRLAALDGGCGLAAAARLVGCAPIPVRSEASTDALARAAFDGDACTGWSTSARAPQAIRAELAGRPRVAALLLVPEGGGGLEAATHLITVGKIAWTARAPFQTGVPHLVVFDPPIAADGFRIDTVHATSNPGWREIVPLACTGPVTIPPDAVEVGVNPTRGQGGLL